MGRFGHDCQGPTVPHADFNLPGSTSIPKAYNTSGKGRNEIVWYDMAGGGPFFLENRVGIIIFGGQTNSGYENDLTFFDLTSSLYYSVRPVITFPVPRSFLSMTSIGNSFYIFAGQDQFFSVLGDLWRADLIPAIPATRYRTLTWSSVTVASASRPNPRYAHVAGSAFRLLYVHGGIGAVVGGVAIIYADLWIFFPTTLNWVQLAPTNPSGFPPTGRYGHSMVSLVTDRGRSFFVFGGITANGDSMELWNFDPNTIVWTLYAPSYEGQLWPFERSFHEFVVMETLLTTDHLRIVNDWADANQGIFSTVEFLANQYERTLMFPDNGNPFLDNVVTWKSKVNLLLSDAKSKALLSYTPGRKIFFLVVYGGECQQIGVLGDMWFFDPITSLWHVPGEAAQVKPDQSINVQAGFSAFFDTGGRRSFTLIVNGDIALLQGGMDDVNMKPASPAYMKLVLNGFSDFSFPFSLYPAKNQPITIYTYVANGVSTVQQVTVNFGLNYPTFNYTYSSMPVRYVFDTRIRVVR
jgi:hypothetical protein